MSRLSRIAATAVLLVLTWSSAVLAAGSQYAAVPWQFMPEEPVWSDAQARLARFPDWDEELLHSLGYREQQTYYHGSRALVTARVQQDSWISILHYSSDGNCYIVLPAGRISPRQQISHSVMLQAGEQGITRVIFWQQEPGRPMLEALASQVEEQAAVTQLFYQAWFPRTDRQESGLPYEPAPFKLYENPPRFAMTDIPAARIQLSMDFLEYCKDSSVTFDGRQNIGTDDWGSCGEWVLSWGDTLRMEVYLPEHALFSDAVLRLYLEQSGLYADSDDEGLQIRVNGRDIQSSQLGGSISVYPKHVDYELGQYMYAGLNVIELKLDAFSTRDWLLQTAEIWIR